MLGAYPDQVWYDPTRPSWLPYVIDTPTESARKYATLWAGNPSGATTDASGNVVQANSAEPTSNTDNYGLYASLGIAALFGLAWLISAVKR